ncbi:MFS transporter [Ornithinibacillus scapharcae]|uniref:MFS transporter n=1 Tax=Ornithinibacillus scapharcae TaxID=1147159 RepID=UPI000225BA52|nr:MFS transporter [Ornithinibacillus scapharcae]
MKNPSYRSVLLSSTTSELGGALFTACNSIVIYELTGSASALGSIWLMYYFPSFFMQLFIGPYVDRWSRKKIMIHCQIIRMLLAIVLLMSLILDAYTIALIYIIQIIVGLIMPIFTPANQAILPTILNNEDLTRANASLDSIRQVMVITGPLLSGLFVDYFAIEWVLLLITIAFAVSAGLLVIIQENYQQNKVRKKWITEFQEGLHYFFAQRIIVLLGVFLGFVQFGVGVTIVTTIPFITTILEQPYSAYGIFMAGFPLGYLIGAFIKQRLENPDGLGILFTSLMIGGCTYLSLGFTPWYSLGVVTEIIAGIVIAIFNIHYVTLIQILIPNHVMGKVTSVRLLIMRTMMPLGILFATLTTTFISIRVLYIIIGCVICVSATLGYVFLRNRNFEYKG